MRQQRSRTRETGPQTIPRAVPYIWVTWLTKLLSGEDQCWWAAWFKAHYKFQKVQRDFDSAAWSAAHNDMLQKQIGRLTADGALCYIEGQNSFAIEGEIATLAGKIDIIAVRNEVGTIIDCKTGKQKDADYQQLLVYLMMAPLGLTHARPITLTGEVHYSDKATLVRREDLTQAARERIVSAIRTAGSPDPPARVPSWGECRFCDISKTDCPERLERQERSAAKGLF